MGQKRQSSGRQKMPILNAKWHLVSVRESEAPVLRALACIQRMERVELVQTIAMVPSHLLHSSASALHWRQQEQALMAWFHLLKVQFCSRAELVEVWAAAYRATSWLSPVLSYLHLAAQVMWLLASSGYQEIMFENKTQIRLCFVIWDHFPPA